MNIQVYSATGSCPYELEFGQKPKAVLFPASVAGVVLEEDQESDGVKVDPAPSRRRSDSTYPSPQRQARRRRSDSTSPSP